MEKLKLPFAFIVLVICFISINSSLLFAQTKGARWIFENNGNDIAAWDNFDNNGSLAGTALFANTGAGVEGSYYLSLEDSSDYGVFTVADHEELDFNNENFAISLWVFPVKGYDNPQYLIMKGDRSGAVKTNNYALRVNNGYLELIVHSESGANGVAKSSFKIVENAWNFVAVFYDYNNSILYMWDNNETAPVDTLDFKAPLFPNNNNLYIGTSGENGFKRFWGRIDDVRIGNKISDIINTATSIKPSKINYLPLGFTLNQNYPNPFNPETIIKFSLAGKGFTKLNIYNLLGIQVASLVNEELDKGQYQVRFNAANIPSGIYLYELRQGSRSELKKMVLIK
ncbi:MAG: LamG-like jellyroll fold domain-containing protein [Ignavibacteriaceae bacterium]